MRIQGLSSYFNPKFNLNCRLEFQRRAKKKKNSGRDKVGPESESIDHHKI